ncbi:hypothetical protein KM043_006521 [Ampulex compressa]|nr:hypothetical protein KM043_006521 [Ampulex compressa]
MSAKGKAEAEREEKGWRGEPSLKLTVAGYPVDILLDVFIYTGGHGAGDEEAALRCCKTEHYYPSSPLPRTLRRPGNRVEEEDAMAKTKNPGNYGQGPLTPTLPPFNPRRCDSRIYIRVSLGRPHFITSHRRASAPSPALRPLVETSAVPAAFTSLCGAPGAGSAFPFFYSGGLIKKSKRGVTSVPGERQKKPKDKGGSRVTGMSQERIGESPGYLLPPESERRRERDGLTGPRRRRKRGRAPTSGIPGLPL